MKLARLGMLLVSGSLILGAAGIFTATDASARMCFRRVCVQRTPFVCHGPIGSCGFMQGACTRYSFQRYFVAGPSCYGPGPVVR